MKTKRFLSIILAVLMCFSVMACGESENAPSNQPTTPNKTATAENGHYSKNTLHKITVTPSNREFIKNGATDYKIVITGDDFEKPFAQKAYEFLQKQFRLSTGAEIVLDTNPSWSENAKYIVLGDKSLFSDAGLSMPADDIGPTGYYIKSKGNSVFVMPGDVYGYQMGAIALLREVIGYDYISADIVLYEKSGETLPDMEIIERPDFDYRTPGSKLDATARYEMGYNYTSDVFVSGSAGAWHNTYYYFPKSEYNDPKKSESYHPNFFSSSDCNDLCYTAHGDEDDYNMMIEIASRKIIEVLELEPTKTAVSFTQQDIASACNCPTCKTLHNAYGGTWSASIIKFLNDVDEVVYKHFEDKAKENGEQMRDYRIVFFAYKGSQAPPTKSTENGYEPIDQSVVCRPNLAVYIAPITMNYNHTVYENENTSHRENMIAWNAICKTKYFWLYEINFSHNYYFYNSVSTIPENYRFCKDMNGELIFQCGPYYLQNATGFCWLKNYMNSKYMFNVNLSYNEVLIKFFKNYFGPAWEKMFDFYNQLVVHSELMEELYPVFNGNIYCELERKEYWPSRTLQTWIELCGQAKEIVANADIPFEKKAIYEKNIRIEEISPRYILLKLHDTVFQEDELLSARKQLRADCEALGVTFTGENHSVNSVWIEWGI